MRQNKHFPGKGHKPQGKSTSTCPSSCIVQYLCACALLLLLAGCGPEIPDQAVLTQRMVRSVELGWPLLAVSDAAPLQVNTKGDTLVALFRYSLRLRQDYHTLPDEERERVDTYLPMCLEVFRSGSGPCPMTEQVTFQQTSSFGWVPSLMLQLRPELLERIVSEDKK